MFYAALEPTLTHLQEGDIKRSIADAGADLINRSTAWRRQSIFQIVSHRKTAPSSAYENLRQDDRSTQAARAGR